MAPMSAKSVAAAEEPHDPGDLGWVCVLVQRAAGPGE